MPLLKSVLDFLILILLMRLLIRPNEAFFHPFYGLVYRLTDPLLVPVRYVSSTATQGIVLTVAGVVILRGILYVLLGGTPLGSGVNASLQELFGLVYQGYMVIWVMAVVGGRGYGSFLIHAMVRALLPVDAAMRLVGIRRGGYVAGSFVLLWLAYGLANLLSYCLLEVQDFPSPSWVGTALAQGLLLFVSLFPFPGFFSLVIILGALLSWVSPDRTNPIVQAIYGISEPVLRPFRRFVPQLGGLDISPLIAILAFQVLGGLAEQLILAALKVVH